MRQEEGGGLVVGPNLLEHVEVLHAAEGDGMPMSSGMRCGSDIYSSK